MRVFRLLCLICLCGAAHFAFAAASPAAVVANTGYDVVLLMGQSNMVGYGTGPDNATDAAISSRVFQWSPYTSTIVPAVDPLDMVQVPYWVGPGLTFAKALLPSMPSGRNILLVGAAAPGTSFSNGFWIAPSGQGPQVTVQRANAALAAAGPNSRLAGIIWHQGESDYGLQGSIYESDLATLIQYLRTNITGATSTTPFVLAEWSYDGMLGPVLSTYPDVNQIMQQYHTLPDNINNTAWVSALGLPSDTLNGIYHFSALSQRQLGRRYADKFFEAANGLPQPQTQMVYWNGQWGDIGRSYPSSTSPVNNYGVVNGTVTSTVDPVRGNVATVSGGQGFIRYQVPGSTFNGSYTKMAWFQPGAAGYYNNLISANNPGQAHFLAAVSATGQVSIAAGQSDGSQVLIQLYQTVPATAGAWMNIALTYNAKTLTMTAYVNGVQVAKATNVPVAPPLAATTLVPLDMGNYGNTGLGFTGTDGQMAGNRVWNTALTASQISAIYNYELAYRAGW